MKESVESSPNRSAAMTKSWAKRRANAAVAAKWWNAPVCICGCCEALVRHPNPDRQWLYRLGHDARLKAVAAGVIRGQIPRSTIPDTARMLKDRIGFLESRTELAKAF